MEVYVLLWGREFRGVFDSVEAAKDDFWAQDVKDWRVYNTSGDLGGVDTIDTSVFVTINKVAVRSLSVTDSATERE